MELLLNFSDTSFNTKVGTISLYMYWTNSQQFVISYTVILIIHSSYVLESSRKHWINGYWPIKSMPQPVTLKKLNGSMKTSKTFQN